MRGVTTIMPPIDEPTPSARCTVDGCNRFAVSCLNHTIDQVHAERARIVALIDEALHVYREHAGTRGALWSLRCRVAEVDR